MEQLNKNQSDNHDSISSPSLEVDIRTMEGDIRALKETGGETMEIKGEKENISRQNEEESDISKFAVPSDNSDNFIFPQSQKANQPSVKPFEPASSNIESVKISMASEKNPVWKTLLIILGILVLAAGFGVLGYYLSPMIFK